MRSKFKWIFTLSLAFIMQLSFAQEKTVKGIVTDAQGPMPGVNVVVKGTQKGVSTGFDGSYAIKANVGDVLVYSFLGMNTVSRTVDATGVANVKMQDDVTKIETVVIVGVGQKRKVDAVTSNYTLTKSDELNRGNASSAVQALIGKVAGLQITTTNSSVSGENRIVFRSPSSITGNNQALIVIDGAISSIGTFNQIPPETILTVNSIKGAQAASVYGSDGVNGVIIVTTKKGGTGKFSANIKSSLDVTSIAYTPIVQLRYGKGWDGLHNIIENGSWGPEFDGSIQPIGMQQVDGSFITAPYVGKKNHFRDFFNEGLVSQNALTLSAGTQDDGYFNLSMNRLVNDFIVKGDQLKRNSFLFKAGRKIGKFSVEGNINYITDNVRQTESGLYDDILNTASNVPIRAFENSQNEGHWTVYANNPFWLRDNQRQILKGEKFTGILNLGYQFNKNISASYLANFRNDTNNNVYYRNEFNGTQLAADYGFSASVTGGYLSAVNSRKRFYGDLIVNFDYELSKDITFKGLLLNNIQDDYSKSAEVGGTNFAVKGLYNINNILNPYTPTQLVFDNDGGSRTLANNSFTRRKVGVLASAEFGYKDYLFLNANARNDWSSVFVSSGNSFFYPSVGASFIPTKAFPSIKGSILNYMKLLGSYTRVGNDSGVGTYGINQQGLVGLGFPFPAPVGNSYVQQTQPTFRDIKPEFVTTKEVGLNVSFFNDRLSVDYAYFIRDTDDLITRQSTSSTSGFRNILNNGGSLQARGYEIELSATPIKSAGDRGFRWDNKINFSHNKTIVTSLPNGATSVSLREPANYGVFAELGQEFPLIKGNYYVRDSFGRVIVDANGLPQESTDQKILGKINPDFIIGFSPSISYKGFRLSATMDYRGGHQFYSSVKSTLTFLGSTIESAENRGGYIFDNSTFDYNGNGVYEANELNTTVVSGAGGGAAYTGYSNNSISGVAENFVIDASAFKVREMTLGYSFSTKLIEKTGLSALSLSVNARNPINVFNKQNRNYGDPEASETSGNVGGLDVFSARYPAQSSYGFAVNLTF